MSDQRPLRGDPTASVRQTGSIREPDAAPRGPRPIGGASAPRTPSAAGPAVAATHFAAQPREPRRRPDPNPLRLMLGVAGLASAAALTTAMLPSISRQAEASTADPVTVDTAAVAPEPSVKHVTRYVTLKPGQTAPPQSTVVVRPKPTPVVTVRVVTKTRQSGKP